MDEALSELSRVLGVVGAPFVDAEVEQGGEALWISDSVRELALDGDRLEIRRCLLKDERHIGTGHRDRDSGRRRIVNKGESRAFAFDLAMFVLQNVRGRRYLHETQHRILH